MYTCVLRVCVCVYISFVYPNSNISIFLLHEISILDFLSSRRATLYTYTKLPGEEGEEKTKKFFMLSWTIVYKYVHLCVCEFLENRFDCFEFFSLALEKKNHRKKWHCAPESSKSHRNTRKQYTFIKASECRAPATATSTSIATGGERERERQRKWNGVYTLFLFASFSFFA